MLKKKLIMNLTSSEKRVAIVEDNQVVEFIIQHPNHEEAAGNIYYGKVTDVLPGMQAAFVDIGISKNGYLYRDDVQKYHLANGERDLAGGRNISKYIYQGEKVIVQIQKESFGTKGPKLTGIIELPGTNIVYLPAGKYIGVSKKMKSERDKWRELGKKWLIDDEGIIFRTSCEGQNEAVVFNELTLLREQFHQITSNLAAVKKPCLLHEENLIVERLIREISISDIEEIVIDQFSIYQTLKKQFSFQRCEPILSYYDRKENIFSYFQLEQELEKALKRIIWLDNGAYIIIEHTEAMTIIDVNTGKYAGKTDLKETVLKTNEMAAKEIARQIRLRDIGGIILIDFIDMKNNEDKKKILYTLQQSFKNDRSRTTIIGFTGLGIVELSRKKVRQNLSMMMTKPCEICDGTGRILSDETVSFQLERVLWEYLHSEIEAVWVETTEAVIRCFSGENNKHLIRLQDALKFEIYLTENKYMKENYAIRHVGTQKDVLTRMENAKSLHNK